jgi:hypothetical protein
MSAALYGIMAEFGRPEALADAVRAARTAGYTRLEAFSPFPLRDLARELGYRPSPVAWLAAATGLAGALIQYLSQYWMNAIDYPLNVGGRPLHSWPAFIPSTLIVAILWAGAAALIGMLLMLRLPRLHHPVFGVPGFERASEDRFFLCIRSDDPLFEPGQARKLLEASSPDAVREVPS